MAAKAAIRAIRWYQRKISANRPACCRYYPTCSQYAIEAVSRFGICRGGLLAVLRLLRCRPWTSCSIDDVPQKYSIFYRCAWSKAHEEPRLTPLAGEDKEN
ncbi:membrane protein insertion efficiency factor YidD [Gardnerella sp. 2492-Sm]|uniref:membrane protein insertion efficiency factor YidD n=1 Tax=unclassified Gardnerella TaxID=2628112 RepID=UPI003CFF8457